MEKVSNIENERIWSANKEVIKVEIVPVSLIKDDKKLANGFLSSNIDKKGTKIDQKPRVEKPLNPQKHGIKKSYKSQSILCSKTGSSESICACSLTTKPSEGEKMRMQPRDEDQDIKRKKVTISSPKVDTNPKKDVTGKRNKKGVRNNHENTIKKYFKSSQCETESGLDDRTMGFGN